MRALIAGVILALAVTSARAEEVCQGDRATVTKFGARYILTNARRVGPDKRDDLLSHVDPTNPARYLRLRIVLEESHGLGWQLVLRDNSYRPLQVMGPADFGKRGSRWSDRLSTAGGTIGTVKLDLRISDAASSATLAVQEYIAMPAKATHAFYSIQGTKPAWADLFTDGSDAWRRTGDAVGMLVGGRGRQTWCCSGVVIRQQPVLLLTNFHCGAPDPGLPDSAFWTPDVCNSTTVDFSWDGDGRSREYECEKVVAVSKPLDVAVLKLAPLGTDPGPPPPEIAFASHGDGGLTIIHHPQCASKQISRNCAVVDPKVHGWWSPSGTEAMETDFTHRCDTEGGSSGAPIFDADRRLIGFHHLGFQVVNGQCDRLNKGVWLSEAKAFLDSIPTDLDGPQ
jgi:Trypsin-like peptidase domain